MGVLAAQGFVPLRRKYQRDRAPSSRQLHVLARLDIIQNVWEVCSCVCDGVALRHIASVHLSVHLASGIPDGAALNGVAPDDRLRTAAHRLTARQADAERDGGSIGVQAKLTRDQGQNPKEGVMSYEVDFENVSTIGLETSPVVAALAGMRANEARYFKNRYGHVFTVEPASKAQPTIDWVHRILKEERDIVIQSRPLEATAFQVESIRIAYVFYESGLSINVMYTINDKKKRAVGLKLSDGMEVPTELAQRFKFARQKSKLAGTIRGSFFVIKGEY
jgi:hypothetical protein